MWHKPISNRNARHRNYMSFGYALVSVRMLHLILTSLPLFISKSGCLIEMEKIPDEWSNYT